MSGLGYEFARVDSDVLFGQDWDKKERNEERARKAGLDFTCSACGRGLKDGSGYTVVVIHGGESVIEPAHWDDAMLLDRTGYMGAWDLGPECAKGIPAFYRVKRS